MNNNILIHAWNIEKKDGIYLLPYSHWLYLSEITKYFDKIILLSPCHYLEHNQFSSSLSISCFDKVVVRELPFSKNGYIGHLKYFLHYMNIYHTEKDISTYYSRYPTPFGWLQKVFGKDKNRIIHYVGDPIDATKNNPNFNNLRKLILVSGFLLEDTLYKWACRGAKVYTNGNHLAEKLLKKGIDVEPLVSSTLTSKDFYFQNKVIKPASINFVYLGNLRAAKGISTLIEAFNLYNKKYPDSSFTIIGSGELESQLKANVKNKNIKNVNFLGRIDNREVLNEELRKSHIFLFASLSEGSPRVILEAMANGLAVISTPVGSLNTVFKDGHDILFSNFSDPESFFRNMEKLSTNCEMYNKLRMNSYSKVKNLTIEKFIERIFNGEK